MHEDLHDLEDLGLIPDETDSDESGQDLDTEKAVDTKPDQSAGVLQQSFGVPWFEELVQGTKLGKMRRRQGGGQSQDGNVQVQWEIIEYSDNGAEEDIDMATPSSGKRKLDERDDDEATA